MKRSIASDAVKLTTSKIINLMISMVSAMLLSRFRTLEEYGTYSQLIIIVNLFTTIFIMGLPNSINYFLARAVNDGDKQDFLSSYYTLTTFLSFLTGLILVISTPLIVSYFNNGIIKNFIYILAVYPWAKITLASIDHIYIVYNKTSQLMFFRILNSLFLLFIIFLAKVFNMGFNSYMILFIVVEIIFALSVYIIVKKISGKLRLCCNKRLIVNILKFSIPLGFATVIGQLSIILDKLVIGRFFTTEELAIYANAAREIPITLVASSLTAVLMPQLVRLLKEKRNAEAIILWGDSIYISYTVICFFSIVLFVYAPEIISLLYSEKYLAGVSVFRVYNLVLLLRFTYFGMILNSIGKTKLILYSSLVSLGINLILNYIFCLIFGFIGPAVATFISIIVIQAVQLLQTSKSINISIKKIFPWYDLIRITILNALLGAFFFYIKRVLDIQIYTSEILESVMLVIIWGIIYVLIMVKSIIKKWQILNNREIVS